MNRITEHGTDCQCSECKDAITEATFDAFVDETSEEKTVEWCNLCDGTGIVIVAIDDEEGTIFRQCHEGCPHRRTLREEPGS